MAVKLTVDDSTGGVRMGLTRAHKEVLIGSPSATELQRRLDALLKS